MKQSLHQQLEDLNAKYKAYYARNRKHLAYGNVKEGIAILKDQIARIERQIALEEK